MGAIARAIIRRPKIILLDEATSALDSKAELVVKDALEDMIAQNSSGCTIIIAHRLTTVKTCDRIIVMDKGHIKEQGSHEELMKIPIEKDKDGEMLRGWYHDLWQTQHGKEDNSESLKALEKENEKLKETALALQADAVKQKQAEVKEISCLQEEIARLKLQSIKLASPQENLIRAKSLPIKFGESETNEDYSGAQQSEMKSALPLEDEANLELSWPDLVSVQGLKL